MKDLIGERLEKCEVLGYGEQKAMNIFYGVFEVEGENKYLLLKSQVGLKYPPSKCLPQTMIGSPGQDIQSLSIHRFLLRGTM